MLITCLTSISQAVCLGSMYKSGKATVLSVDLIFMNNKTQVSYFFRLNCSQCLLTQDMTIRSPECDFHMPLFHQRIKHRSCRRPLIVGSLGKNGKKIDQWGGRQNRYEGLGLTTDQPQDAPGGPRQSLTGLGLRTD